MFDGEMKTYLDVRAYVEAAFGPLEAATEIIFLTKLGDVLRTMWADLRKDPWYLTTWTVTPASELYHLPADLARICEATGTTEGVSPAPDVVVTYRLHAAGCTATNGACTPGNVVTWGCSSVTELAAQVGASLITPEDEPDTIEIIGYRVPDRSFFTMVDPEPVDGPCRQWKNIDLPAPFRSVFADAVVGMMFFAGGDAPRGADWLNLANNEFAALKRAHPSMTGEIDVYQMGSRSYLGPKRCCNLGDGWRLSL